MKVTTEALERRQLSMLIEADAERVEKELRIAARSLAGRLRLPGFRKGKAPYNVVLRMVGKAALYEEFVDKLGQELFAAAIEQEDIEPSAMASLDEIVTLEPLVYRLTIPLSPTVTLGDYMSLRVDEAPVEVDEELIVAALEDMRSQHAGWSAATRPSEYGDSMNINVRAVVLDESGDEPVETDQVVLDETDWEVLPDQEYPMDPPGFDEALLGLGAGESKEFVLGWPEDSQSLYKGKSAKFTVTVNSIEAYQSPELDDAFAALASDGEFATLDEMKANLRSQKQEENAAKSKDDYLGMVLEAMVAQAELDYPPALIEREMDIMLDQMEQQVRQMGLRDLDHYLELIKQDRADYRESLREQAEAQLRRTLVIGEFVQSTKIGVTDVELEEYILGMINLDEEEEEFAAVEDFDLGDEYDDDEFDDDEFDDESDDDDDLEEDDDESDDDDDSDDDESDDDESDDDESDDDTEEEDDDVEEDGEAEEELPKLSRRESMQGFIDILLQEPNRSGIEGELLTKKAFDLLTAIAKGEDVTEMLAAAQAAKAVAEIETAVEAEAELVAEIVAEVEAEVEAEEAADADAE